MLRRRNKLSSGSKRAFTLVELIVVLVILAIVAAMLVPALTGYIKRAKREHYYDEAYYARVAAQSVMQELYAAGDNALTNTTEDGNNVIWNTGEDKKWGDRILSLPAITTRSFGGESFRNTIVLNGASIPLQFFIVSNRTGINPSNTGFWTGTGSNSLLSHADGYYGK